MKLLGYVTITDYDKFIESYEKFITENKNENIWGKYCLSNLYNNDTGDFRDRWGDKCPNQSSVDLSSIYDRYCRSNYSYANCIENFKKDIKSCQKYQKLYNQKYKLIYDCADFCIINFGSFNFIIFDKTYLNFEYLKDYSNINVNQIMGSVDGSDRESLIPYDITNRTLSEQEQQINNQKDLLGKLENDIKDVKDAKTEELAALQKEIDDKVAELNSKKEKLLEQLNEKKSLLNKKMEELQMQLFMLETEIYAIRCFLGEVIDFIKLKSGRSEPSSTPIILFQKIKFLDEELGRLVSLYDVDFDDKDLFEKYLVSSDFALEQFCPSKKCISLVRVSKTGHAVTVSSEVANMVEEYKKYHGKTIGILIRDGENVYIGWTDDDKISIKEDMFYRSEVKSYYDDTDAESYDNSTKEEIASRYFIFSILQGLLESDKNIISLDGKHSFTHPDKMIIYSTADNWIIDNRFGTLETLIDEYSEKVMPKVGDDIILLQSLRPDWNNNRYEHNDRGIGYANRTHDVSAGNAEVLKINKITETHDYGIQYTSDKLNHNSTYLSSTYSYPSQKEIDEYFNKNPDKKFKGIYDHITYNYYVSLYKELNWAKSEEDYKILPRANFRVYKDEFINLVFFNSIWLEYIITNKAIGNIKLGRANLDYADLIKHLKVALQTIKDREQKEFELINSLGFNLNNVNEWPVKMSKFKYDNNIHKIGPRAAKQFIRWVKNLED